ncbi:MAG: DUF3375 domain-containing protein [Deltaproteobacteria bacterium]|jgi:hypothetical protein|nr:DUF3375 domain-containing protein [Deltaproteobacteria bacterium]
MSSEKRVSQYLGLKEAPLWKLLSADSAPYVIAILQTVLYDNRDGRVLKGAEATVRVGLELEKLRDSGLDGLSRPAQEYLNSWVASGYLIRRIPQGADEEEYELSAAATDAIRFVSGMASQRVAVTESRLASITEGLARLAEDTDPDMTRRAEGLREDMARIGRELALIERGEAKTLPVPVSLERIKEILSQSLHLIDDFRHVKDRFFELHRNLRERTLILDETMGRGEVAREVFDGIDSIERSEAGRSFDAFYAMLTNEAWQGNFRRSLDAAYESDYFPELEPHERDFLHTIVATLLKQSMAVHQETTALSKSLENLVKSRAFRERKRLMELIAEAKREALAAKELVSPIKPLELSLFLTSARLGSVSQLAPFDPATVFSPEALRRAPPATVDFAEVTGSILASAIDYRTLLDRVIEAVRLLTRASIADVLNLFPADQGLGSVMGLVHLAHLHGERGEGRETVEWDGLDGAHRSARIDKWYFFLETINELFPGR